MTAKDAKTTAFLQALNVAPASEPVQSSAADAPVKAPANDEQPKEKPQARSRTAANRSGLKHIGGYFDRTDVEKIAILRARLGLDNSELIKLAIEDLYRKHEAKRAFGDA